MGTYIPLLVLASYVIAAFGSYAGLTLAIQLFQAPEEKKNQLHWMGAFALGGGIWSMHFIGMLAYKMDMAVEYNTWLTLLSALPAIVVAWFVLQITQVEKLSAARLVLSAVLMGSGIAAMHYIGMAAMQMQASLRYIPSLFFVSIAIAVVASGAALWVVFILARRNMRHAVIWRVVAALVMATAICGMHYTGVAAAVITPFADAHAMAGQNLEFLAAVVTASAVVIILGLLTFTAYRRFFLIFVAGAIFALPLEVIVYQAITVMDADILNTQKEQYGVEYHAHLLELLQRLQEVRGLTYASRNGGSEFAEVLQSKKAELNTAIMAADEVDRSYGDMLDAPRSWQAVKDKISSLTSAVSPPAPNDEFKQYSDVIQSLTNFMGDVADNSHLSVDPQLDTDYLADAAVRGIPAIMETIGKMRGLTTGLLASGKQPPQWTGMETQELQALYTQLRLEDEDIDDALERARRANETSAQFNGYHDDTIAPKLEEFEKHFEQMIFAHVSDLSADDVFHQATDLIGLYNKLYGKTADAFLVLLKQHQKEYAVRRALIVYFSGAAFLGFFALFAFLYRSLAKTERTEQAAIAASRIKSDFLANMSHELRTPLNSIIGMERMLAEAKLDDKHHQLADTVFRSSTNLLEIINDILDISKIEAGEMKLEHIGFDLRYVFHSVVHALDHIAKEKRIAIVREYEKEPFPYLLGDPTRVGRILMNLIGNAVKYTPKGEVTVRAFCKKLDETHIEFRCEVADTGIGIPKDKQKSVFEKFTQADASTTRKYGGTGLGLAITKELVEMMDGTIGVESEEGKGSTFWFAIPFEITDKLHEEKHIRQQKALLGTIPPQEARILVAEDHPMNQIFIQTLLNDFGIQKIKIVENGTEVVEAFKQGDWDVILMDCHMPGKNGYDASKEIRILEEGSKKRIPIVAMTANAMVGDREKCLRFGMDEYVSKPINADQLKETLGQWLHFADQTAQGEEKNVTPTDKVLDLSELQTFAKGRKDVEKKLIEAFLMQSDANMAVLRANGMGGDLKAWQEAAHMFKGGASGMGAEVLTNLCDEAQHFDGADSERANLCQKIEHEYVRVKDCLKEMGYFA